MLTTRIVRASATPHLFYEPAIHQRNTLVENMADLPSGFPARPLRASATPCQGKDSARPGLVMTARCALTAEAHEGSDEDRPGRELRTK